MLQSDSVRASMNHGSNPPHSTNQTPQKVSNVLIRILLMRSFSPFSDCSTIEIENHSSSRSYDCDFQNLSGINAAGSNWRQQSRCWAAAMGCRWLDDPNSVEMNTSMNHASEDGRLKKCNLSFLVLGFPYSSEPLLFSCVSDFAVIMLTCFHSEFEIDTNLCNIWHGRLAHSDFSLDPRDCLFCLVGGIPSTLQLDLLLFRINLPSIGEGNGVYGEQPHRVVLETQPRTRDGSQ
ncbi:hypothetical protein L2E82_22675 [Cichorium intybus]|uniref:Uncharacterized protein n=1 Tax=Cichorium intybus TaxID=13427 RepID=A0ACB9DYV8_CICIN|nr:hypothetical protein L2E82_22675 [Cichorium intybus]